jgi:hypothetical protein
MNITIRRHKKLKYVVSARELYQFLNTRESFDTIFMWKIKRCIENEDYIILNGSVPYEDNTPRIDYLITIEVVVSILRGFFLRCWASEINNKNIQAKKYFMLFRRKECIKEKIKKLTYKLNVIDERLTDIYDNKDFNITFK